MSLLTNVLIGVKVVFFIAAIAYTLLTHFGTQAQMDKWGVKLDYIKERTEFIFKVSMSILLIIWFHPIIDSTMRNNQQVKLDAESRLLIFLFGWVMVLTANWKQFIQDTWWLKGRITGGQTTTTTSSQPPQNQVQTAPQPLIQQQKTTAPHTQCVPYNTSI